MSRAFCLALLLKRGIHIRHAGYVPKQNPVGCVFFNGSKFLIRDRRADVGEFDAEQAAKPATFFRTIQGDNFCIFDIPDQFAGCIFDAHHPQSMAGIVESKTLRFRQDPIKIFDAQAIYQKLAELPSDG